MKKVNFILLLALMLAVFACTIPSEIEIKGSIKNIRFDAGMNFDDIFEDLIGDSFTGIENSTFFECQKTVSKTFIIYMPLFKSELESSFDADFDDNYLDLSGENYVVTAREDLVNEDIEAINFDGLSDYLTDFIFSGVKARLFISGTEIVEHLHMDIEINGSISDSIYGFEPDQNCVVNEAAWKQYTSFSQLAGGVEIDLESYINGPSDSTLVISVYIPAGTTIPAELVDDDIYIEAELVLWIPMEFEAGSDGAEMQFPSEFFDGVGSFVSSVTDYMEGLKIEIFMGSNPFQNGTLVMKQAGTSLNIRNSLKDSFNFAIKPNDMKIIEGLSENFKPTVSIEFDKEKTLFIPREFGSIVIGLEADLFFNIPLDEGL